MKRLSVGRTLCESQLTQQITAVKLVLESLEFSSSLTPADFTLVLTAVVVALGGTPKICQQTKSPGFLLYRYVIFRNPALFSIKQKSYIGETITSEKRPCCYLVISLLYPTLFSNEYPDSLASSVGTPLDLKVKQLIL